MPADLDPGRPQLSLGRTGKLAEAEPALTSLINPDDSAFQTPGNMPEAIRAVCQTHGQPVPASDGAVIRCVLESLALKCRYVLDALEDLTGRLKTIHVVGGGVQNRQLCQATADACRAACWRDRPRPRHWAI